MVEILSALRSGRTDEVARRSPAYRKVATPVDELNAVAIVTSPDQTEMLDDRAAGREPSRQRNPRIQEAREFRTLVAEEVLEIHLALVEDFARTPDPIVPSGVKHPDLLESAVARQFTSLGGEPKYKTLAHMAASLFYGLALNHPFHNGNKRTALVALICLADANHLNVTASEDDLYAFVLRVVNHEFRPAAEMSASAATDDEVLAMAAWIRPRLKRKEHFQRSIRWREMKAALRRFDVVLEPAAGSQLELIRGKLRTVVDFDGDSREVGRPIVRKIRGDLELMPRNGCDDDVFYGDALPLDHFIAKYRGLLRELAHV
jgi:death-on-curing protein